MFESTCRQPCFPSLLCIQEVSSCSIPSLHLNNTSRFRLPTKWPQTQIYGKARSHMVLELNASDDRGIDVVRQEVQDFASSRFMFSDKFKLVILDECDAMTRDAQMALRRGTSEEQP